MKIISIVAGFLSSAFIYGQQEVPVTWNAAYKAISEKDGEIILSATIAQGWHTYSQRPTDAGPIPTSFSYTPMKSYKLDGKTVESDAHEEFVPAFDAKIFVFTGKAEFRQKLKLNGKAGFILPVKIEYMCCNDRMCLPPKVAELKVKVP
jgi:hypothetical protein